MIYSELGLIKENNIKVSCWVICFMIREGFWIILIFTFLNKTSIVSCVFLQWPSLFNFSRFHAWPSQYWKRRASNQFDSYSINYRILILVYFSFWLYVEWRSPITLHFQPVIESLKSTSSHFSNSLQYPHVWHTVSRLL